MSQVVATAGRIALFLVLLLAAEKATAREPLRIAVLDVGEGQSVLLSRGQHGILIDTGHFGRAGPVLDKLAGRGVETLDYLILTHLHPDHASGFFRIHEAFPDALVVDSGHTDGFTPALDSVRWVADALRELPRAKRRIVSAGERIRWRGAEILVLWPDRTRGERLNRNSLVLEVRFGPRTALIMGDADTHVEQALLDGGRTGPVGVLGAAHHGASDTGSRTFLESVKPAHSVISVNAGNIRGYPDPQTVRLLKQISSRVSMTADTGDVVFSWPAD